VSVGSEPILLDHFGAEIWGGGQGGHSGPLNDNWFISLTHPREVIEELQNDYNDVRPQSLPQLFS